ncbi:PF14238 domain protein [Leptospira inadai serovar Lyme str. 10]|uniref:PF14238 domain protein n=2 Tax=Leptospira inadai serovar Lyme TaxID=293084 RepID=V6HTY5_9LEPT|nr:DUF4340 domain-containing protein [Leptospira inadai]EQA36194.1 PF14238 domain protein [Leptospira inadai serovar Lyme str. 10]PNV74886.1 DUF4340 domain-containing protein [Leptospira inadai serovar Lyme]
MRWSKLLRTVPEFIRSNPGISLFLANLFLALLLLLARDPWEVFKDTYAHADPFFPVKESEISKVVVGRKGEAVVLSRTIDSWEVWLSNGKRGRGDSERIETFLKGILALRKYTLLSQGNPPRSLSPEFGLDGDEPSLEVFDASGSSLGILYLGSLATRHAGMHVLEPRSGKIWLVRENLKLLSGNSKPDYFFSRSLFSEVLSDASIQSIRLTFSGHSEKNFSLVNSADDWNLSTSEFSKPASAEEVNRFAEMLFRLKADEISFENKEEIVPIRSDENFQVELQSESETELLSPIGKTKQGSWVFQRKDLNYKLILDPWTLEPILRKDLADFTYRGRHSFQ